MKANLIGAGIEVKGVLTTKDFLDFLCGLNVFEETCRGGKYLINMKKQEDYYYGIIVKTRDSSHSISLIEEEGSHKIDLKNLLDNERIMEFNPFVLLRESGRGIYMNYSGATNLPSFFALLKRRFNVFLKNETEQAVKLIEILKEKNKEKKKFKETKFFAAEIYTPEEYDKLVDQLTDLNKFSYAYETIRIAEGNQIPEDFQDSIEKVWTTLTFKPQVSLDNRKMAVKGYFKKFAKKFFRGVINGKDKNGKEENINIFENFERFGVDDFDRVAGLFKGATIENFESVSYYKSLVKIIKKSPVF